MLVAAAGAIARPAASGASGVVGGRSIQVQQAPWTVYVQYQSGNVRYLCTGSIVDASHVLTAAHCVYDDSGRLATPSQVTVRAGVSNYSSPLPTDLEQDRPVSLIRVHPGYRPSPAGRSRRRRRDRAREPARPERPGRPGGRAPDCRDAFPTGASVGLAGFGRSSPTVQTSGPLSWMTATVDPQGECSSDACRGAHREQRDRRSAPRPRRAPSATATAAAASSPPRDSRARRRRQRWRRRLRRRQPRDLHLHRRARDPPVRPGLGQPAVRASRDQRDVPRREVGPAARRREHDLRARPAAGSAPQPRFTYSFVDPPTARCCRPAEPHLPDPGRRRRRDRSRARSPPRTTAARPRGDRRRPPAVKPAPQVKILKVGALAGTRGRRAEPSRLAADPARPLGARSRSASPRRSRSRGKLCHSTSERRRRLGDLPVHLQVPHQAERPGRQVAHRRSAPSRAPRTRLGAPLTISKS